MIDLIDAKKIMKEIPSDILLNFPHQGKKLEVEYSWEDENYYIFDVFAIPKTMKLRNMSEAQKDKYAVVVWRVDKATGQAEEWTE